MISRTLASFQERFGISPDSFSSFHLFTRKNNVWCCTPQAGEAAFPQIVRRGLRIARVFDYTVKPTTNGMQLFGHLVTRNRLELTTEAAQVFVNGGTQQVNIPDDVSDGFVVPFHMNYPLGVGLLKGASLKSQVPRSRRVIG
jgi:NOL1/NOP2/fmu family ribosome biogenesis protein